MFCSEGDFTLGADSEGKMRKNTEGQENWNKRLKSTHCSPLFVSVIFTQRKIPLLGLPLPVSVMVCHRGASLGIARLGPLRRCWEGRRGPMESVPRLMGIVEILQVWAVFMSKNVVVS